MNRLIRNAIQTPDGTIIESRHTHDFKIHKDANGLEYMVDGGLSYTRRFVHVKAPYIELSVYLEDGHERVRENVTWGTYGKAGDQPLKLVTLCDMEDDHIVACLDNVPTMHPNYKQAFKDELKHRGINYESQT